MKIRIKKILIYSGIVSTILFILICTIPFLITTSKASDTEHVKVFKNSDYILIDNILIHYRIWKNPEPSNSDNWILLLHGMGGSTYSWENNAQVFCDSGYNVVAVDIPPFGYSDKDPDFNNSIDNRAELLWKFANRINLKASWVIIGHSMGGGIAQCMSILKPDKVKKVVFVAPALFNKLENKFSFSQILVSFKPVEKIMCIVGERILIRPKRIKKILTSAFAMEPSDSVVDAYYSALAVDGTAKAFIRSFSKSKVLNPVDGKLFKTPSIAFFGSKDTWVPYESQKPILDLLKSIKIISVPEAGHNLMETNYDFFNQKVLAFLKD